MFSDGQVDGERTTCITPFHCKVSGKMDQEVDMYTFWCGTRFFGIRFDRIKVCRGIWL